MRGILTREAYKFQFTPLREGRRSAGGLPTAPAVISIHAPPRGATSPRCARICLTIFQFTPLREGRLGVLPETKRLIFYFNSRPSARGDAVRVHQRQRAEHFNSRPSARSDIDISEDAPKEAISIHAPPRGATPLGVSG